jgi:SpoIID/LytB domain protein
VAIFSVFFVAAAAQREVTDADLVSAGAGRTVRVGTPTTGRVTIIPLESYVARVLAGEGEPRAADAAQQALAVAIRTFALANAGRHRRDGYDLCDSTHCQVLRAATPVTRRAALATAGRVLTYNGRPAEVFYSASCGGHSEAASQVWPGADYAYLQAVEDDVHADDEAWTVEFPVGQVERALRLAGWEGRLRQVEVETRSSSGRVTRLRVDGLRPALITGDQFRGAVGARELRSTAFELESRRGVLRFIGRGYGHGVGMCVIGAGRRARRGESAEAILAKYFPGLELTESGDRGTPIAAPRSPIPDLQRLAARAHDELSKTLGTSVAPLVVQQHDTLEAFRAATGRPWWTSVVTSGTAIDLAPLPLLEQRDGLEAAIRQGVAELLVAGPLAGRSAWVRLGAARYFARGATAPPLQKGQCPSDAELTLAVSAAAQRDAEVRAEQCFARALQRGTPWRDVR